MTETQLRNILREDRMILRGELRKELREDLREDLEDFNEQINKRLTYHLADFFGKQSRYFDQRFAALEDRLDQRIDRLYNLMDGFAKRQEIDQHERLAMARQLNRHDQWIGRAASQLKIKYNPTA
jgi:hypothetical protein